jgi:hypothetical protein
MTENALLEVHPRAGRYVKTNQLLIKKKRKGHHASTHDGAPDSLSGHEPFPVMSRIIDYYWPDFTF